MCHAEQIGRLIQPGAEGGALGPLGSSGNPRAQAPGTTSGDGSGGDSGGDTEAALRALESDMASASVLVVDDNEQNLELLLAYLEELGCSSRAARHGAAALEAVAAEPPDLILLDVMMPRMSGFQVCEKLKANPQTRDIPVVMVTALNEVSDIERAVESGADDFLTKPVHKIELLTRARSLLRVRLLRKRLHEALRRVQDLTEGQEP